MPSPEARAAALADAHRRPVDGLPDGPRLVDVAESSRVGDWSLRSALVRFAQPEPTRAGAVLELVRRTDGALKPHRRRLEAARASTHPTLGPDAFVEVDGALSLAPGLARVVDTRASDLARVLVRLPDGDAVLAAYTAAEETPAEEIDAARLLAVAVELDALADALVAWAGVHEGPPPVELVDERAAAAFRRLAALGVEREPRSGGRTSRS